MPLSDQKSGQVIAAGLPSDLMVTRPDVLAAEERLRAASANVCAARAAFFPTISLPRSLGFASIAFETLFIEDGLRDRHTVVQGKRAYVRLVLSVPRVLNTNK